MRSKALFSEDGHLKVVLDLADNGRLDDPESRTRALELVQVLSEVLI